MDSVIEAESDKAFEKDITSWSDKEALSVQMLPAPDINTSLNVMLSEKDVINSMLGLSVNEAVSALLVDIA